MLINITNEEFRKIVADTAVVYGKKRGDFYFDIEVMRDPEDGLDDGAFSGAVWLELLKYYQVEQ